jgi:hypothetical protein
VFASPLRTFWKFRCHNTSGGQNEACFGGEGFRSTLPGGFRYLITGTAWTAVSLFMYCTCVFKADYLVQFPPPMFRATFRLLDCRITFFTRTPCSLCDTAKTVVQNVQKQRVFKYNEINVMEPGQEKWKALYEFDTPVVRLVRWNVARKSLIHG